jgi:DNA-binding response OmpR family regulator
VLVHRLRRKIDRPGRPLAVETIRGAGCIIKDDAA